MTCVTDFPDTTYSVVTVFPFSVTDFRILPGNGLTGTSGGSILSGGSEAYFRSLALLTEADIHPEKECRVIWTPLGACSFYPYRSMTDDELAAFRARLPKI